MKAFFWPIFICLVPNILALAVDGVATKNYLQGNDGLTFKLGGDLAGGTKLVYEIDPDKKPKGGQYAGAQALAAVLKKRIDPLDIHNVTIRPLGDTRIEIILPTGGMRKQQAIERAWEELLGKVNEKWPPRKDLLPAAYFASQVVADSGSPWTNLTWCTDNSWAKLPTTGEYNVSRGQIEPLIDQIQEYYPKVESKEIQEYIAANYKYGKGTRDVTSEGVQEIKDKIARQGSLEFRILANTVDDQKAIDAAFKYLKDPANKSELDTLARKNLPPPPPGGEGAKFESPLGSYSYHWIELGKEERHSLNIDNEALTDNTLVTVGSPGEERKVPRKTQSRWNLFADARKAGEPLRYPLSLGEGLFYSRDVVDANRLPEEDREKKYEYFVLTRDSEKGTEVTGDYLTSATVGAGDRGVGQAVHFTFNSTGARLFGELTTKNAPVEGKKRSLAIVMDGQIMSAPTINAVITDSGQISGTFTPKELNRLVEILRSGALPATLKPLPVSETTVSPSLGEDTIRAGTFSVLLAFAAILIFMLVYYRFAGCVACVALLSNLVLTLAFMVVVSAPFTLPGLAGLVLMLGMAVDANVLIYERIREERDRGSSLALAIRNGYSRALPTIIDTHLSSIFTAIVLYVFGNAELKGFGVTLTVGLIISLFTSLYMTHVLFNIWLNRNWLSKLSMMRLFSKPNIDFMGIRYYWFTATILLTIFGITVFLVRGKSGLNYDIAGGGTSYTGELADFMDMKTLRNHFSEEAQKEKLQVKSVELLNPMVRKIEVTLVEGMKDVPTVVPLTQEMPLDLARTPANLKAALKLGPDEPPPVVKESADVRILEPADPKATMFKITYKDGQSDTIQLPNPATKAEVEKRASELPDLSVEQTYSSSPEFTRGRESKLFTVRTSEKAPELVRFCIGEILGKALKLVDLKTPEYNPNNREVTLTFGTPASPALVSRLFQRQIQGQGPAGTTPTFHVSGEGKGVDARFLKLHISLDEAMNPKQLHTAVDGLQGSLGKPQPEQLDNFDSQLAADTQRSALIAILLSWAAILLYLWFRFSNWTFGAAAVLCLIHDLFFTLGIIAFCHYIHVWAPGVAQFLLIQDFKIDLPSVAALLTLVGYSTNDTIVVFDRIREVRGKNPELTPKTINDSVNQTLSRTLLTSFSVWLVVFVLYVWGGEGIHLFAFVMVVGVIVGTYSSIYIASPLLLIFGEGKHPSQARRQVPETAGVR